MTTLPRVPVAYNVAVERERSRKVEAALAQTHKRGQDLEVGQARLILTSDDGTRYELEVANDGYVKIRTINGVDVPGLNQSQFSENVVAERTSIIELNSSYGLSAIRDVETVTGSGAITAAASGEILLSTGATATSTARLDSAERIRYKPGHGAEMGIGVRIPTLPTGNQEAKWGMRTPDGNEGAYWGVDATGVYIATLRGGTEAKVRPASFNMDALDGTGKSGITLDLSEGTIFQIDFTWYGYGQIRFDIVTVVNDVQQVISAHWFKPDGATSLQTPNLPIFAEVDNGGDAADLDLYVGGRQASIVGQYNPKYRTCSQERIGVSTSTTSIPLVSFRNKTGFQDRSIRIDGGAAAVASEDHVIEFYVNASLTGESWTTPTNMAAAETSLETDVSATAISGGTLVYAFYAKAGEANKEAVTDISTDFDVPENQSITMAARTVTGTGTAGVFFRMREEW